MPDYKAALTRYDEALQHKADASNKSKELVALDEWYRTELRGSSFLTLADLLKLMQWKLARGKFRPTLMKLINSNASQDVERATKQAFATYKAEKGEAALDELVTLRGVGPATASAILAMWKPEVEPFMSDEAIEAVGLPREYTKKAWVAWRRAMLNELASDDAKEMTMEDLEKAMYAAAVLSIGPGAPQGKQEASKTKPRKEQQKKREEPVEEGRPAKKAKK